MSGIIWYLSFSVWLTSLSMIIFSFISGLSSDAMQLSLVYAEYLIKRDLRWQKQGHAKWHCLLILAKISVSVQLRKYLTVRPEKWNFIYGSKYIVLLLETYIFNLKDKNASCRLSPQNGIYRMNGILLDCKVRCLREKFKMLIQVFIGL